LLTYPNCDGTSLLKDTHRRSQSTVPELLKDGTTLACYDSIIKQLTIHQAQSWYAPTPLWEVNSYPLLKRSKNILWHIVTMITRNRHTDVYDILRSLSLTTTALPWRRLQN